MDALHINFRLLTGVLDGTIPRNPFVEKRYYFDIEYGHVDKHLELGGSYIEDINRTRIKP